MENWIAISMDCKGAWRDNVFVERLWRSVKYEEVYIKAYDNVSEARASIGRYLDFYNGRRPHSRSHGVWIATISGGRLRLLIRSLWRRPMSFDHHSEEPTAIRTNLAAIFVSMELSRSIWMITCLL